MVGNWQADGTSPLMLAASHGKEELVRRLLDNGAAINQASVSVLAAWRLQCSIVIVRMGASITLAVM